jgi:hypothetical protein
MSLLRSKKVSFSILAALITANWLVGQRTIEHGASTTANLPPISATSPHLPTLESIQSWSTSKTDQVSSGIQRFTAPIFIASLPGSPIFPTQVEPTQQLTDSALAASARQASAASSTSQTSGDLRNATDEQAAPAPTPRERSRAPRSEDLLKVLAAFYILNR